MRMILLAGLMSMAAAEAGAASIDRIGARDESSSIDRITCPVCAPLKTEEEEEPEVYLEPGTQKVEVKEVNGELKVFRTEAWLGGSPVTYVSKASTDLIDKKSAEAVPADSQKTQPLAIDENTTSAVTADMSATEPAAKPQPETADIGKDALKLETDPVPVLSNTQANAITADMSEGATAKVEQPKQAESFNPQDLQLRTETK